MARNLTTGTLTGWIEIFLLSARYSKCHSAIHLASVPQYCTYCTVCSNEGAHRVLFIHTDTSHGGTEGPSWVADRVNQLGHRWRRYRTPCWAEGWGYSTACRYSFSNYPRSVLKPTLGRYRSTVAPGLHVAYKVGGDNRLVVVEGGERYVCAVTVSPSHERTSRLAAQSLPDGSNGPILMGLAPEQLRPSVEFLSTAPSTGDDT